VVHDERLVGTWKRTVTGDTVRVRTHLAPGADAGLVRAAAQRLADVYERRLEYVTTAP
jgi:hypothetical protein